MGKFYNLYLDETKYNKDGKFMHGIAGMAVPFNPRRDIFKRFWCLLYRINKKQLTFCVAISIIIISSMFKIDFFYQMVAIHRIDKTFRRGIASAKSDSTQLILRYPDLLSLKKEMLSASLFMFIFPYPVLGFLNYVDVNKIGSHVRL